MQALRRPQLWAAGLMIVILVVLSFHELLIGAGMPESIGSVLGLGLTRHTLERILFLIPIAYAAAALGFGAGLGVLVLAAITMALRVVLVSPAPREAVFETGGVVVTGALIVFLFDALQKGKHRMAELESARTALDLQVHRLGMLHVISGIASQSLVLGQVLAIVEKVAQSMSAEASWLYLVDAKTGELELAAYKGVAPGALPSSIPVGQEVDGAVALSREPAAISDVALDPASASGPLAKAGLHGVLVVPLIGKETPGTLGVGSTSPRPFALDEVELLHAIAAQISMAIENARLFERERSAAEALSVSEKNYRELFENATDPIWVHDLDGKILEANDALANLLGYERHELVGANVSAILSGEFQDGIDSATHNVALRWGSAMPYERKMARKNHTITVVQIGTSLITRDGKPWAFQHIARDVTEEKRIQDNLRSYVRQVSQAQEAERKRIARELHDDTAQALVAVLRNLEDLESGRSRLTPGEIRDQIREILREIRHFSQQLRPSILDDLGLLPALNWLAADLNDNYRVSTDVSVAGQPRQLSPDADLMVFRIVQEALNNVRKHAQARRVHVAVEFDEAALRVTVCDDGKGFKMPESVGDLARTGQLGLVGMHERAQLLGGRLTIRSEPGRGTTLTLEVPASPPPL